MAAGRSYLTDADVGVVDQARRDILATRIAMQHDVSVVIKRQQSNGTFTDLSPVTVDLRIAEAGVVPATAVNDAAASSIVRGRLRKELPFDVRAGDRFVTPDGWVAAVTLVETHPAGIATAWFEVNTGATR